MYRGRHVLDRMVSLRSPCARGSHPSAKCYPIMPPFIDRRWDCQDTSTDYYDIMTDYYDIASNNSDQKTTQSHLLSKNIWWFFVQINTFSRWVRKRNSWISLYLVFIIVLKSKWLIKRNNFISLSDSYYDYVNSNLWNYRLKFELIFWIAAITFFNSSVPQNLSKFSQHSQCQSQWLHRQRQDDYYCKSLIILND